MATAKCVSDLINATILFFYSSKNLTTSKTTSCLTTQSNFDLIENVIDLLACLIWSFYLVSNGYGLYLWYVQPFGYK